MLPTSDDAMEASLEESAVASVPDQLRASFLDHLQDIHEAAGLASVHPQDNVAYISEDTDSENAAAHRSKLRKRWNQQATETPPTPSLLNSPGGSSGSTPWLLVNQEATEAGVPSASCASGSTSRFQLSSSQSSPKSTLLGPTSKASSWRAPSVCLRYNSPFQLSCAAKQTMNAKPLPRPSFGVPRAGPKHVPIQLGSAGVPQQPRPLPTYRSASSYAVYPKDASAVQLSFAVPSPPPQPAGAQQLAATSGCSFSRQRCRLQDAFTTSQDVHREQHYRNSALFSELCQSHGSFSSVLTQLSQSQHGQVIKERLLSKVSDTTASRYLRSVQLFFVAFEELGGKLEQINEGLFLDAFFTVSRSSEDGPLSNSQNVLKALRWYKKLLGLVTLPDLYGSAFSLMSASSEQEKKESIPLPLIFVAFLEGILLSSTSSLEDQVWAGSFLTAISASLRFADCQHVRWSSLCISQFLLRGLCFRTKTTRSGAPWGLISWGPISCSESPGMTWLPRWVAALDSIWHSLKLRFGPQIVPDCLFFFWAENAFTPASYSQTLCKLRCFLVRAGITAQQARTYTLHSLKTTFLSWMAQLSLPLSSRFLQGHHKPPGSAQLYSRDDVWPALKAQVLLWRAIHSGFRPARPQHRGGQTPLTEPPLELAGTSWSALSPQLKCFHIEDDASDFLTKESQDEELREARVVSEPELGTTPKLPACVHVRPQVEPFVDSDGDEPGPQLPSTSTAAALEAEPSWQPAAEPTVAPPPKAWPKATASLPQECASVRFLLSTSGVAHACISHPGSRIVCLVCNCPSCEIRCHPACGCITDFTPASKMPEDARLCKRKACLLASTTDRAQ